MPTVSVPRIGTPFKPPDTRIQDNSSAVVGVVQGVQQIAQVFNRMDAERDAARRATKKAHVVSELARGLADLEDAASKDPDYATVPKRFEEDSKNLYKSMTPDLDRDMKDQTQAAFDTMFLNSLIRVRAGAWKNESSEMVAGLDKRSLEYEQIAGLSEDPSQREIAMQMFDDDLRSAVESQYISAEDAQKRREKFSQTAEFSRIKQMIRNDPMNAFNVLNSPDWESAAGTASSSLTPTQVQYLRDLSVDEYRQLVNDEWNRNTRTYTMAERQRKERGDKLARDTFHLRSIGKLTPEYVLANKDNYETSGEFQAALKMATSGGGEYDNEEKLIELHELLGRQDITHHLSVAFRSDLITEGTYVSLSNLNRNLADERKVPGPYKESLSYIQDALDPGLMSGVASQALRVARANAKQEWNSWAIEHPGASRDEHLSQAKLLVNRYAIIQYDNMLLSVGKPYGLESISAGDINEEDLDQSESALVSAHSEGRVSEREFSVQLQRLQNFRSSLSVKRAGESAAGSSTNGAGSRFNARK